MSLYFAERQRCFFTVEAGRMDSSNSWDTQRGEHPDIRIREPISSPLLTEVRWLAPVRPRAKIGGGYIIVCATMTRSGVVATPITYLRQSRTRPRCETHR